MITDKASYDKAKAELKDKQWRKDNLQGSAEFTWHMKQHIALISAALLAYRRANNIFEVGDLIKANDWQFGFDELYKIDDFFADDDGVNLAVLDDGDCYPLSYLIHATDEEIKANRRLDQ